MPYHQTLHELRGLKIEQEARLRQSEIRTEDKHTKE